MNKKKKKKEEEKKHPYTQKAHFLSLNYMCCI